MGFELCKILYMRNATVCIAGRAESKAQKAVAEIKKAHPESSGKIDYLILDLSDLSTIKPAVEKFLARQPRLDVLVNNAGVSIYYCYYCYHLINIPSFSLLASQVMIPPKGSVDAQGYELQLGTNCLGSYLLYQLLLPLLSRTASDSSSPTASVRVLWAASLAVHTSGAKSPGVFLGADGGPTDQGVWANYAQSKVGNAFLARELAKTTAETGVVHAAFNPGNLRTELQRHTSGLAFELAVCSLLFFFFFGVVFSSAVWIELRMLTSPFLRGLESSLAVPCH